MNELRLPRGEVTIETRASGLDILVPPERHWLVVGFITIWLTGIAYLGLTWWPRIIGVVATGEAGGGDYFIAFVMSGLTLGWFKFVGIVLRMLFGLKRMQLRPGQMYLSRGPALLGLTDTYKLGDVVGLHAPESGGLAFRYHGRLERFASDLDQAESARLLDRLFEAVPALRR